MKKLGQQIKEYDGLIDLLEDLDKEGVTGFQRQEQYRRFLNLQARMRGQILSVGFELTPLCNFDCKMCYVHLKEKQIEKSNKLLDKEQWIDIMRQAIDAGMMYADLTGGECLTYSGFRDIYLYLQNRGIAVSVLTNGQLISEEIADLFAEYPPSVVQITIYGSTEEAYEAVTGRRAFADVCAGIERLKKRGIRLFLTITPTQYTQKDVHALLEFLRSQGVSYGIGTGSLPARPETGRKLDSYCPSVDVYEKLYIDERAYQNALGIHDSSQVEMVSRVPKGFKTICKLPCSSGQCTCHINWKGEMQPCVPFYTIAYSVLEKGFETAWTCIKETMKMYEPPEKCTRCPHVSKCVSCPAEKTKGVLNGPVNDEICRRYERYEAT